MFEDVGDSIPGLRVAAQPAETGDEAYLRRVALSHAQARPPIQRSTSEAAEEALSSLAYNPFAPPSVPPPPGPPGTLVPNAFEDKAKAAAAIAARLGALATTAGVEGSTGSASPGTPTAYDQNEATSKK